MPLHINCGRFVDAVQLYAEQRAPLFPLPPRDFQGRSDHGSCPSVEYTTEIKYVWSNVSYVSGRLRPMALLRLEGSRL